MSLELKQSHRHVGPEERAEPESTHLLQTETEAPEVCKVLERAYV